jgi:hypothetical protein
MEQELLILPSETTHGICFSNKYRGWSQMEGLEVPAPLATLSIKRLESIITLKSLGARKRKGINRIAEIN